MTNDIMVSMRTLRKIKKKYGRLQGWKVGHCKRAHAAYVVSKWWPCMRWPICLWRAVCESRSLPSRASPSWDFWASRNPVWTRGRGWGRSEGRVYLLTSVHAAHPQTGTKALSQSRPYLMWIWNKIKQKENLKDLLLLIYYLDYSSQELLSINTFMWTAVVAFPP